MLFSEAYNLDSIKDEDWFDPELKWDTKLFLDLVLVINNKVEGFENSKDKIKDFFDEAFKRVALAKGKNDMKLKKNALRILQFREPSELGLGYTNFGYGGSGIGKDFSDKIFHAIVDFIDWGLEEFEEYLGSFELFAEGVGPDRLSDMAANILKKDLIKYTQKICNKHKVPMKRIIIQNASFDKEIGWIHEKTDLPINPINKKPILLVPKDFLRTGRDSREEFLDYIFHMENDELRNQATRIITEDLNKKKLKEVASQNIDFFKELIKKYIKDMKKERVAYDLENDPSLLWKFRGELEKIKEKVTGFVIPEKNENNLKKFVEEVISQFKRHVEDREGYLLLFNDDGKPRGERVVQIIFWGIAEAMCEKTENSPDISPEAKTGRGLIDFKFSNGYANKILVEIKLAKSTKLYTGLETQFPTYLKSEKVDLGFYLVVKQLGGDNARFIRLEDKYEKMPVEIKDKIILKEVDAYPENKPSASSIK